VPGHADVLDVPGVLELPHRLEHAVVAEDLRDVPVIFETVYEIQVDAIGAQAFERLFDLGFCAVVITFARFGTDKDLVAVALECKA